MAKLVAGEIDTTVNFNEEQPAFMTKGGQGDTSTGGNVKTDAWFQSHTLHRAILDTGKIAQQAKDQEIRLAAGKLLHRFSPELSVLLARDMINASAKFAVDSSYLSFAAEHQEFLK